LRNRCRIGGRRFAFPPYGGNATNDSTDISGVRWNQPGERAPRELAAGTLKVLCTVDLYNDGVDIPEANTLRLLRPTQSPVVFQQQLGRSLRLVDSKDSCLVLDFVGRLQNDFRFELAMLAAALQRQREPTDARAGVEISPRGIRRRRCRDAPLVRGPQGRWRWPPTSPQSARDLDTEG
jgi:hypothetical protein